MFGRILLTCCHIEELALAPFSFRQAWQPPYRCKYSSRYVHCEYQLKISPNLLLHVLAVFPQDMHAAVNAAHHSFLNPPVCSGDIVADPVRSGEVESGEEMLRFVDCPAGMGLLYADA